MFFWRGRHDTNVASLASLASLDLRCCDVHEDMTSAFEGHVLRLVVEIIFSLLFLTLLLLFVPFQPSSSSCQQDTSKTANIEPEAMFGQTTLL